MGDVDQFTLWALSSFALSLRIAPVFLFAPPFTLMKVPPLFLWLMGMAFAAMLATAFPATTRLPDAQPATLIIACTRELSVGLVPVLCLRLMFGALYMAGRTLDIQAGFGLSLLIDPTTKGQMPLIGTIFAYLAGASFFAMNGHHDLIRFFAASLELVPLGGDRQTINLVALTSYMFTVFFMAFGVGAAAILVLFIADISIAALSRTVPQLNALLLGIQIKALLVIFALMAAFGLSGVVLVKMCTLALQSMITLL